MSIYTNDQYYHSHPSWDMEDAPYKTRQILAILEANCIDPRSVADVGCGAGGVTKALAKHWPSRTTIDGYEISPRAIALCCRRKSRVANFYLEDITRTRRRYDLLIATDVLEHIEDLYGYLRKLRKHARHHVFYVPLEFNVRGVLRENDAVVLRRETGHLHLFSRALWLETLRYAGYKVLDSRFCVTSLDRDIVRRYPAMKRLWLLRKIAYNLNPTWAARVLGGTSLLVLAE